MSEPHPYKNPDERCIYPVKGMSYCWSYAHHKDGAPALGNLAAICANCELWTESPTFDPKEA